MTGWNGKRIVKGKYQVFDGRSFLGYDYDKKTAIEVATKGAQREGRAYQVWHNSTSGLVCQLTINP